MLNNSEVLGQAFNYEYDEAGVRSIVNQLANGTWERFTLIKNLFGDVVAIYHMGAVVVMFMKCSKCFQKIDENSELCSCGKPNDKFLSKLKLNPHQSKIIIVKAIHPLLKFWIVMLAGLTIMLVLDIFFSTRRIGAGGSSRIEFYTAFRNFAVYNYIFSVALDISQSDYWRQLLFSNDYRVKFLINSSSEFYFPNSTVLLIAKHNLQFYVSKVRKCPIRYMMEDGYVIFKFQSVEFPEVVQYSGN